MLKHLLVSKVKQPPILWLMPRLLCEVGVCYSLAADRYVRSVRPAYPGCISTGKTIIKTLLRLWLTRTLYTFSSSLSHNEFFSAWKFADSHKVAQRCKLLSARGQPKWLWRLSAKKNCAAKRKVGHLETEPESFTNKRKNCRLRSALRLRCLC